MERGDEIELTINAVAFGGSGVGRYGKMVVFVPFSVDGDMVSVKIVTVKKSFATATLQFVHFPSPFRITPRCEAYTRCGACSYQHITYEHQVVLKHRQVRDALKRIGRFDTIPLENMIPSPQAYGYRGRADFHVTTGKGKERIIGFAARATNDIVDLERCEIVHESINDALFRIRGEGRRAGRLPLWSTPAEEVSGSCILRRVKAREMLVPRDGFFQANLYLTDTLVDVVEKFCNLSGTETVLDGYCGSGLFSLFLAPRCGRIYGIEAKRDAIRCAKENMNQAGINLAFFYTGDIAHVLWNRFIRESIPVDVVLVDPPRIGLEQDALEALIALNPAKIVYVSCNPSTLARDLRALAGFGYYIRRVQPLDMFPQTSHIETVVLLERDHSL
jgi:23S rRNA (uracil1939-C5)-methyltransferase